LKSFESQISEYKKARDFPSLDKTSKLSMHFRFGTLSIREAVRLASKIRSEGSRTWLSELIWRDFYQMILDQFPHVEQGCFKKECDQLTWTGDEEHFSAWVNGRTGFPIIDAAMRHFQNTGWMHNRLRMVVASFLTKDLLINWKKGERYFAQKLLDYDFAANNGGWQWSASTGCDAQPYFRVFNPVSQSKKFDPDGEFIRAHIPELKKFSSKYIHCPFETPLSLQMEWGCIIGKNYPEPIVDHATSREAAIKMFKALKT
jgi:deoxyribodipyrimidine photo-lyase